MSRPKYNLVKSLVNDAIPETVRKTANNTLEYELEGGGRGVQLHDTEIIRITQEGIALNSGGYKTLTTKSRMNDYIPYPWSLYQESGVWYLTNLSRGWENAPRWVFKDGITIDGDTIIGDAGNADKISLQRKQIKKYAKDYIEALMNGDVSKPSNGDCWYCLMRVNGTDQTLGEANNDTSHLESHMRESYYVPSLLLRAIEVCPVSMAASWVLGKLWGEETDQSFDPWDAIGAEQMESSLTKYLLRQFGMAS